MYTYIYIYIYIYLTNTDCLIRPCLFELCVFRRVKDHPNLLHCSPLLKKICVRQVVLDEWFPLTALYIYIDNCFR